MGIFSAIVGGASVILGGLLGLSGQKSANRSNLRAVQETNEANRRLTERQYQMAQEFWRMNNEYNIPSNQMQRLKDAGLNPYLVYGNGTVVGNSSSMPSVPNAIPQQAFTGNKNELSPLGDSFSGLVGSISQLETMRTQRQLMNADIESKKADIEVKKSQKTHQDIENEILGNNAVAEGKMSQAKLDNLTADTGLKQAQETLALKQGYRSDDLIDKRLEVLQSQYDLNVATKENLQARTGKVAYEIGEILSRVSLNSATKKNILEKTTNYTLLNGVLKYKIEQGAPQIEIDQLKNELTKAEAEARQAWLFLGTKGSIGETVKTFLNSLFGEMRQYYGDY